MKIDRETAMGMMEKAVNVAKAHIDYAVEMSEMDLRAFELTVTMKVESVLEDLKKVKRQLTISRHFFDDLISL